MLVVSGRDQHRRRWCRKCFRWANRHLSFRKSNNRHDQWDAFVAANAELIAATDLPSQLFRTETALVDFLTSGVARELSLSMAALPEKQFISLEAVVNAYFYDGWVQKSMVALSKCRLERFGRYA